MSVSVPRCYDTTDPGLGADDRHGYRQPAHRRALRARCAACAAEGGGRAVEGRSTKITGMGRAVAAQFGYLPGTLWILVGAVLGGCVQDMTILLLSTRRDGRSLGQMARDELGPLGGFAALTGTLAIMIILIAVLGLVIVNAMKHSPWGTSTVFATIPVAILVGIYLRFLRPGRVLQASLPGLALVPLPVGGGGWVGDRGG